MSVDLATLGLRIDSSDVRTGVSELDRLTAAGSKAERAVDRLGDAAQTTGRQTQTASQAAAAMAANAQRQAAAATGAATGIRAVGSASQLSAPHMGNLAFQLNDVAVGLASGQSAFHVFVQQGAQIAQIAQQSGVGFGGMAAQVGRATGSFLRANPLLAALGVTAGGAAISFEAFRRSVDSTGELDAFAASLGLTKDELEELGPVSITASDAIRGVWQTIDEGLGLSAVFSSIKEWAIDAFDTIGTAGRFVAVNTAAAFISTARGIGVVWQNLPGIVGDAAAAAANAVLRVMEQMLNAGITRLNTLITNVNGALANMGMPAIDTIATVAFPRLENAAAGTMQRVDGILREGFRNAQAEADAALTGLGNRLRSNILGAARDRISEAANEIIGNRRDRAGGGAGRADTEDPFSADRSRQIADRMMQQLNSRFMADFERRLASQAELLDETAERAGQAWLNAREAARGVAETDFRNFLDELNALTRAFDQIGGSVGRGLAQFSGALEGLATGDFGNVTGRLGGFLSLVTRGSDGQALVREFGDKLDEIFGGQGEFTKKMESVLQGAGLGLAVGGALFGNSAGGQIGSAFGGVIGKELGKEVGKELTGLAKELAGPLGGVIGGLIGGAIGQMLSKTPRASASIGLVNGSLGITGTTGNSSSRRAAANSGANSILEALTNIADQLGGELTGNAAVSIGVRKNSYRVDTSGQGITKTSRGAIDFGQDAEAAIKFAIADAVRDGAIAGLRAGTQALISGQGDIEAQLAKALRFESVFKDLKARTDPLGFALEELTREFDGLRKVFAEAGASAAEYAQLEQLFAIRREEAIKDANREAEEAARSRRSLEIRMMELQGNAAAALAAARELEIQQMDAALRPLQRAIFQMEDLRETVDRFTGLATTLREFRDSLTGGADGAGGYSAALARFQETANLATAGNADAMAKLPGVSQTFLDAARANASTSQQYQRDVARVLGAVDRSVFAADTAADYAQLQIDAIAHSNAILTSIDAGIQGIAAAQSPLIPASIAPNNDALIAEVQQLRNEVARMRAENHTQSLTIAENTSAMARLWNRFDGDGLLIRTDADTPIQVETVA